MHSHNMHESSVDAKDGTLMTSEPTEYLLQQEESIVGVLTSHQGRGPCDKDASDWV